MTQKSVIGPLSESNLGNEFWFEPAKIFHLFGGDAFAEMALATARQIVEGTFVCQEWAHCFEKTTARCGVETLAHFSGEEQFLSVVITRQNRLETSGVGFVATNHELLRFIDFKFEPGGYASTGTIKGVALFGDDPFKAGG